MTDSLHIIPVFSTAFELKRGGCTFFFTGGKNNFHKILGGGIFYLFVKNVLILKLYGL
jgi:hypothetical protein